MSTERPLSLVMYGRPECGLCDEMHAVVESLVDEFRFVLEHVDISGNPDLEARFGEQIPVLFIEGRKAFKVRATRQDLWLRLRRATGARG